MNNKRIALALGVIGLLAVIYISGGIMAEKMMIAGIHEQVSPERLEAACEEQYGEEWDYMGPDMVDGEVVRGSPFDIPRLASSGGPTVRDNVTIACRLDEPLPLERVTVNVSREST